MRPVLAVLALLGSFGLVLSQPVDAKLELGGIGFALEEDTTGQLSVTEPQSLMIKILTSEGKYLENSSIRLRYETYPLEVVQLTNNYLEAKVYSTVITTSNELVRGEHLGKLTVTLAMFAGLEGAKGSLTIGAKTYRVLLYLNQALEGFARWSEE